MTPKEALERIHHKLLVEEDTESGGHITIGNIEDKLDLDIIESALNRLEELEQIAIKGFNPNTDEYEYGQLFYSEENGYELKNKDGELLTNKMIQKSNDDYFKMEKVLEIIKKKGLSINDIAFIKNRKSCETYIKTMKKLYWSDEYLDRVLKTKEEYDLLKKYLK